MKRKASIWAITVVSVILVTAFPVLAQTFSPRTAPQQPPASATTVMSNAVPVAPSGGCNVPYSAPGAIIVKNPTLISSMELKVNDTAAGEWRILWNPPSVAPRFTPSLACFNDYVIDIGRMPAGVTCWMLTNNLAPSGNWAVHVISCMTAGADSGRPVTQTAPAADPGQPAAIIDPLFKSGGGK